LKHAIPPPTIGLMTGLAARRFLFFRWEAEVWQTFERKQGLAEFARRFVAFPHRMVVVAPDFAQFDSRHDQGFVYTPTFAASGSKRRRGNWSQEETAFFRRCLDRIGAARAGAEPAEVAYVPGNFLVDDGGRRSAPVAAIEHRVEVMSKQRCVERIVPALHAGIGAEEGGIYAPYTGEGVFVLSSI
jgi:hypothetical protein